MKEQWKTIAGFEAYEVSDLGRVRRAVKDRYSKDCGLKPNIKKDYLTVCLYKHRKKKYRRVHILVALAFLPNPKNLSDVNHKDGVKKNCQVSNLEWRSFAGNIQHAMRRNLLGDGVYFDKPSRKWAARYSCAHKRVWLGFFTTKAEALEARRKAVQNLPEVL